MNRGARQARERRRRTISRIFFQTSRQPRRAPALVLLPVHKRGARRVRGTAIAMPTPRVSRSAGATPSGGAGAGRGETRSPPARRVSPRDRRADKKARSPAHARSPLAEIFGSPEAGAARRGSSLGVAREDKARRARAPSPEEEEDDEAQAIMATQAAPCEAVGGDAPSSRPGGDVFDRRPSGAPEETTPSATPLADPTHPGASAETATEAATRRLSERVYRDTGRRLASSWTARYDERESPSGASAGKRRRLWFVSPGGKRFDGPGKVSAFVSTPRAKEGTDFLREGEGEARRRRSEAKAKTRRKRVAARTAPVVARSRSGRTRHESRERDEAASRTARRTSSRTAAKKKKKKRGRDDEEKEASPPRRKKRRRRPRTRRQTRGRLARRRRTKTKTKTKNKTPRRRRRRRRLRRRRLTTSVFSTASSSLARARSFRRCRTLCSRRREMTKT